MITIPKFRTASKQNIRTFALPSENQTYTFKMQYAYDSYNRIRLSHLRSYTASGTKMQDITYSYDSASNITHVSNSAGSVSGLGGRYEGHYTYDNLYRLAAANGYWKNSRDSLPFSESMNYTANGRILKKTVNARILSGNHSTTKSSDFRYNYAGHGNQVSTITDNGTFPVVTQSFQWDDCGNVDRWAMLSKTGTQWLRTHTWTEDNRLQTVADNNWFSYYQYDAGGERTYKLTWAGSTSNRSGDRSIYYTPDEATLYASPYFVVTPQGYTKHYYAETERVASQMGRGKFSDVNTSIADSTATAAKKQAVLAPIRNRQQITSSNVQFFVYLSSLTNRLNDTSECYFYHPDHLGSSSWITDSAGTAVQHIHYLPFGETFVSQRSADFDAMYTFSAKEKDTETGYLYFGARYYSSDLSIWLSVDPMADKYPSMSPYVYCANNPVKLVDPNGEEIDDDIVVYGTNNSSITYKTDLFDLQFKVDMDFGGNYNVNGENIAYGIEYGLEASAVAGTGTSYNGYKQSVKFNGGKYTDYCYDYIGGEAQIVGSGLDVSVGAQANFIIGLFLGDPNDATPESFAGDYQGVNGSRSLVSGKLIKPWGVSVDLNVSFALSKTEKKWLVITFGPSVSYGFSKYSKYTAGYHIGCSKLLGSPIPTKERSCWDMTRNKITHPNPLLWLF
ncbi:MAG: RHS repeat-associated core domain-containing protein [Bacteroidales bacterium]|nr:RHS repeat-associated core domain-containing protein [Bacteroidales bacterium]